MTTVLQALVIAILAIVGMRMQKGQTRSRLLSGLKAWFTVLVFWALLTHPIEIEPGKSVIALQLIRDQLSRIEHLVAQRLKASEAREGPSLMGMRPSAVADATNAEPADAGATKVP